MACTASIYNSTVHQNKQYCNLCWQTDFLNYLARKAQGAAAKKRRVEAHKKWAEDDDREMMGDVATGPAGGDGADVFYGNHGY